MEYESELQKIRDARNSMHKPLAPIFIVVIVLAFLVPIVGQLAFLAMGLFFYLRLVGVARLLCPKCNEPFGTSSRIVLGMGTDKCENCGLSLH